MRTICGTIHDGRVCRTPARASASRTACGWGIPATAADRESKVSEAELAALRDKAASLKKELKEVLAAKRGKPEVDMRAKDGDGPI